MPERSVAWATRVYLASPASLPSRLPPAVKVQEVAFGESVVTGIQLGVLSEMVKPKFELFIHWPLIWLWMAIRTLLKPTVPLAVPEIVLSGGLMPGRLFSGRVMVAVGATVL